MKEDFSKKKIGIDLTIAMLKKIDDISKRTGNSRNSVLRELLDAALSRREKSNV